MTSLRRQSVFAIATLLGATVAAHADVGRNIYRQDAVGRRACAHCHGYDGRGSSEGRPAPSDITWRVLTTERGYRDASSLMRAVSEGQAPDGRRLAMPLMALDDREARELINYLGRIEAEDRRGAQDGLVTLAVGFSGDADPFPALLTQALDRRGGGRSVFGWRFQLEPLTVEKLVRLEQGTTFFAAVGVTEPIADAAARALARHDIPNLMPRGFFVGFEARETSFGLFPTLSRVADAAETAGCRAADMALQTAILTDAERVERFLRIPILAPGIRPSTVRRPNCVLRVVAVPAIGTVNLLLMQRGLGDISAAEVLVFDPLAQWSGRAGQDLYGFADLMALSLLDALASMRGNPGRTSFMKAFRHSVEGGAKVRRSTPASPISSAGIAATNDVLFVPLRLRTE